MVCIFRLSFGLPSRASCRVFLRFADLVVYERGMVEKKCEHGRRRRRCKDCGGSAFCEHGRQRNSCKDCGGSGICEHGRRRSVCKECVGGSICEHGRRRTQCKECCGGGGPVTFLEATEVEEFDGEEDPDEWVPTVQARVVGGPRGGKRKR